MRIIISPAKKMEPCDLLPVQGKPVFAKEAETVRAYLRSLSFPERKKVLACSEALVRDADAFLFADGLPESPAILSYIGIQYQYMAPAAMEAEALSYLQEHLRILSAVYGSLRPFDGITPYRLEMQAKTGLPLGNLYAFWGEKLSDQVMEGDRSGILINLASAEYAKAVVPYAEKKAKVIQIVFGEEDGGTIRTKGVYAKMARGDMVRYLAENRIEDPREICSYSRMNYRFDAAKSDEHTFCFVR